ncbi:FUSC family protein [Vibrio fluvialis]|nr:FUSC family protein [Vibrio fluvialis]
MKAQLANLGLDSGRLAFALRTALASCLALFIGWKLGLEHPQWAAMSVWAASQPGRGMLLEKSLFRFVGTVIGTLVGVALVYLAGDNILLLALGLSLWVGLCAGAGNVIHGLFSYATLLSGYSASLVALLGTANQTNMLELGMDRLLTVLTGVIIALLVGMMFARKSDEDALVWRVRTLTISVLQALLQHARQQPFSQPLEHLMLEAAQIEEALEPHSAGSLRSRRSVQSLRSVVFSLISILTWLTHQRTRIDGEEFVTQIQHAINVHELQSPLEQVVAHLKLANEACDDLTLSQALTELGQALSGRHTFRERGKLDNYSVSGNVVLHRDWVGASQAMYRTTSLMVMLGLGWALSGSPVGAYVLLGASVMVTLFSTFENPALIMTHIFWWQLVGAAANLICQLWLWPLAANEWQMLLMMVPFILLGVVPFAHRRLSSGSMDYFMIFLLLSHPQQPYSADSTHAIVMALAVVAGPMLALLAFKLIFPTNLVRRQQLLMEAMWHALPSLIQHGTPFNFWQARMKHRVLKLIAMTRKNGLNWAEHSETGLTLVLLGQCLHHWQQIASHSTSEYHQQRHQVWLKRLQHALNQSPQATIELLHRYARQEQQRTPQPSLMAERAALRLSEYLPRWQRLKRR